MNKLILVPLLLLSTSAMAIDETTATETELIKNALKEGYQAQRNLAFFYQTGSAAHGGSDLIAKDETKSCAWRKILLIANPTKTDASDPSNERFSCRNLDFKQDELVWKLVYEYLPQINNLKAKGQYMVTKVDENESGELTIIDVDN
ncbi:TPA: hypothetical protein MYR53_002196 [Escherichia coli]|nr:hypothetical protein [Escherichia coli]HDW2387494.1 hypothetical protein [Escherichia coli]